MTVVVVARRGVDAVVHAAALAVSPDLVEVTHVSSVLLGPKVLKSAWYQVTGHGEPKGVPPSPSPSAYASRCRHFQRAGMGPGDSRKFGEAVHCRCSLRSNGRSSIDYFPQLARRKSRALSGWQSFYPEHWKSSLRFRTYREEVNCGDRREGEVFHQEL